MLVSYNWLNKYFDGKLPTPEVVADAFTFHAWEIEEVKEVEGDTLLDIKVLPDKSMWALSHRGIAKDLSVILNIPLAKDPLKETTSINISGESTSIEISSSTCRRFAAAHIKNVKVGPSPDWLRDALVTIGQRSINNIVDASNYVMFDLGQPSHAFDAKLVGSNGFHVRQAETGETLTGLDEKEYTFTAEDTVIARGDNNEILSIAGLKGGKHSGISEETTDVIVEVANWDPIATRKTGQRLKLRTDASARYENGIVPEIVPAGLQAVVNLIIEVAGGEVVGYNEVVKETFTNKPVTVLLAKINSVLGISLSISDVTGIFDRFGWSYQVENNAFSVTPPFERTDLNIAEDIIEEIGRINGYDSIPAIIPTPVSLNEINQRFYYSEIIRDTLMKLGFSEIYTSSFRNKDNVKLLNAFASDKGYLRSNLAANMTEALAKNAPNSDLLGIRQVQIFEIGTVFNENGEQFNLALGVQSPSGYKAKNDEPILTKALHSLSEALGVEVGTSTHNGIAEIDLGRLLTKLPKATTYNTNPEILNTSYKSFSNYPATARDIALWVNADTDINTIEDILNGAAGELRVRTTLFDQFEKDGRTSYAFRLVFQATNRTLTDMEVNEIMEKVYNSAREAGFEVR